MSLQRLDHWVMTVADVDATCRFYKTALGCETIQFGNNRRALRIGDSPQKINLHPASAPFQPAAQMPQPGSADLCFITETPMAEVMAHFQHLGISLVEGPVERTGTLTPLLSVYIRDPDGNLIEISNALAPYPD
ncbi:MAG: VOC family protein [Cyanobacteria bacterium J06649_4]